MDAWYSSLDNLKSIRSHGWVWVTTLRKNRIVNHNKQLNKLDISEEGTPTQVSHRNIKFQKWLKSNS
nr:hypothetical protein [Candidatus Arsenophonus triatominarum]